jgi:hypothetical protein
MAAGGAARRSPMCNAIMVPWLNPTSASADGGNLRRASSASTKCSSTGPALLTPSQRSFGARVNSGNHWRPVGAWPHGSGACGETKAVSGNKPCQARPRSIRSLPSAP